MGFISDEERKRILAQMLSGQLMRPPPPVEATPGTPLPVVPLEAPVVAPQSEQAVAQPFDEFAGIRSLLPQRQFTATGNKDIDAILARSAQTQQQGAQNFLNVMSQARMNPEEEGLLADRRTRIAAEMAQLDKDKKRAGWEALARAGFKMAQSNSPYFMQALASGMEAGLEGLNESKLKRDEKKSRLQTADEDARIAAIRGRQSAQDRALSIYNAALASGKTDQEARDAALRSAITEKTLPQQLEMADLEVKGKKADIALTEARRIDALRGPVGRGGGGGGGTPGPAKPLPPGARAEAEGRLATAYSEQDEAYRKWVKAGKPILGQVAEGTKDWEAASTYEAARGKVNNILTTLGKRTLGPAPVRAGKRITQAQRNASQRPAAAKPKSKPKPAAYPDARQGIDGEWYVVRGGQTYKVEG